MGLSGNGPLHKAFREMDNSEYHPTGAEIDDAKLFGGEDSIMGDWTASCILWVIAAVIFLAGFGLGMVVGARMF